MKALILPFFNLQRRLKACLISKKVTKLGDQEKDPLAIALEQRKSSKAQRFLTRVFMKRFRDTHRIWPNQSRKAKPLQISWSLQTVITHRHKNKSPNTTHPSLVSRKIRIRIERNRYMHFHLRSRPCSNLNKQSNYKRWCNQIVREILCSKSWRKLLTITAILKRILQSLRIFQSFILLKSFSWTLKEKEG